MFEKINEEKYNLLSRHLFFEKIQIELLCERIDLNFLKKQYN
jgi:hypothetical protein